LVGLTRQQIWKTAHTIPGAVKSGKQWRFDAANPAFRDWIKHRKRALEGAKRMPSWSVDLRKLQSRIRHSDPLVWDDFDVTLVARIVGTLYGRLLETQSHLAGELLRKIGNHVENVNQRSREAKRSGLLGEEGGSGPRMNGKPMLNLRKSW
jgi:hypothetical protein